MSSVGHILSQPIDQVGRVMPHPQKSHFLFCFLGDAKVGKSALLLGAVRVRRTRYRTSRPMSTRATSRPYR